MERDAYEECNRLAHLSSSTGSTDSVDVVLDGEREGDVDDEGNVRDVESSSGDICRMSGFYSQL
jgi:hypothetical protein